MAFKVYAAVYVFLRREGQVYLMRRDNTGYRDGQYSLPAGHVEENESLVEAVLREVKEESGLELQPENIMLRHASYRRCVNDRTYADYFFVCENWQGEPIIAEPHKCGEALWADENALPDETVVEVMAAWQRIVAGEPFSEIVVG